MGFFYPVPRCHKMWARRRNGDEVVCLQTRTSTCAPAAAATLLNAYGIPATEQEMAYLCLSTEYGTTLHGLYRGLKIKTAGTEWDVEVFRSDVDRLREFKRPVLLLQLRLPEGTPPDSRYRDEWGWQPGVSHAAVLFEFLPGGLFLRVGDPAVGVERWSLKALEDLWHREGVRLVRRNRRARDRE
jgi:hypothetical protein